MKSDYLNLLEYKSSTNYLLNIMILIPKNINLSLVQALLCVNTYFEIIMNTFEKLKYNLDITTKRDKIDQKYEEQNLSV